LDLLYGRLNQIPKAVRSLEEAVETWEKASRPPSALREAKALLKDAASTSPGAWVDYWFGGSVTWFRRGIGLLLSFGLVFVLSLVVAEKNLIPGIQTPIEWKVAAVLAGMLFALLLLPTVGRLKVGPSGVDVEPAAPVTDPARMFQIAIKEAKPAYSLEKITSAFAVRQRMALM
jgi:hypothetical protein